MGGTFGGGFAEEHQLPATSLRRIPEGVDFATAASFTTAYLTAYVSLVRRGDLQAGETLAGAWRGRRRGAGGRRSGQASGRDA